MKAKTQIKIREFVTPSKRHILQLLNVDGGVIEILEWWDADEWTQAGACFSPQFPTLLKELVHIVNSTLPGIHEPR